MTQPSPFLTNTRFFPSPDDGHYLQRELNLMYNDIANSLNSKDIGIYALEQTSTGQNFFSQTSTQSSRFTNRIVYQVPSILNGTTSIDHGLQLLPTTVFTRIYGTATNPLTSFLPIPYLNVSSPSNGIQLNVTSTQVQLVTTSASYTSYSAIIVLEFIPS